LHAEFHTDEAPDVTLEARVGTLPDLAGWELAFDSKGVWQLYRRDERWAVRLSSPVPTPGPYRAAVFSGDFLRGEITTAAASFAISQDPFPLQYPLAEVLMIHLLARGRGLLMHACAVRDGDEGLLFAGTSGAGKSTMARLWRRHTGATLLSDDRVILRQHDDGFWIYGTPWHGDARAVSPERAPLRRVFILGHGRGNRAARLSPIQASAALLVRSFPTYWDLPGMEWSLQLLARLSQAAPIYDFDFVPDEGAIEYVRGLSEG
jgi:hypothetical protein